MTPSLQFLKQSLKAWLPARLVQASWVLRHGMPYFYSYAHAPGMISKEERAFYADCASGLVGKPGVLVDLGCWMGATTLALAEGLRRRTAPGGETQEQVIALDRFLWADWMNEMLPHLFGDYRPGDCFLPEARRRVRRFGACVQLVQADLTQYEWDGRPIKLLLVDAMKSWALARQIACSFYPSLQPGSLLLHQDYKHYYTSWLHLLQYRLRAYFQPVRCVPRSGTFAFASQQPLPRETVVAASAFEAIANDEVEEAFRWSLALVDGQETANVAAAHVMHYLHTQQHEQAERTYASYASTGLVTQGEFHYLSRHWELKDNQLPRAA